MLTVSETSLGTSEAAWSADPALRRVPGLRRVDPRRLVVVAPHPDDETFGAAGLLRAAARSGASIEIVAVTDGEASHPGTPWVGPRMATRRRAEAADALARLGLRDVRVHRCAIPDGRVGEHEQQLVRRLEQILDGDTWCATTWRHDGHPDHDATGRAAHVATEATGSRLLEFPVWAWHWARPGIDLPLDRARRLDLDESDRIAKVAATAAYASQIRPVSPGPDGAAILPPAVLARFHRPFELFFTGGER